MSSEPQPRIRYRLQHGRPKRDLTAPPTRVIHVALPIDLFDHAYGNLKEADVSWGVSGLEGGGYMADYVRAALLVFDVLLQGPSRARVLALANLPEDRIPSVISRLDFHWGAQWDRDHPPLTSIAGERAMADEQQYSEVYTQNEGVEPLSESAAPTSEVAPWEKF